MHDYSAEYCLHMVAHYRAQMTNVGKPASWRALAFASMSDWMHRLETAAR